MRSNAAARGEVFARNGRRYQPAAQADRHFYLDRLRIMAILLVFFHHCAKFFDYDSFTLYNSVRSLGMSAFREFNFLWMMPLFFIISGAAVYYSFQRRSTGEFLKERVIRILVPLVILGTFVINPPQVYLDKLFQGATSTNFIAWYPQFFEGFYLGGGNFAPLGMGTHMWYLQSLFLYSLILLPFFIPGRRTGQSLAARLADRFESPRALFLMFVPISVAAALAELIGIGFTRIAGGWDMLTFFVIFFMGYMLFSNERLLEHVRKYGPACLAAAILLTWFHLDSHFGVHLKVPLLTRHDLAHNGAVLPYSLIGGMLIQAFRGLLCWCWLIAVLGLGQRLLNFEKTKALSYASEAVLPFYILHHPFVYLAGYYVIQLDAGIPAKFAIIVVSSFAVIMALYEFLVRRQNVLRFLFGMKLDVSAVALKKALPTP